MFDGQYYDRVDEVAMGSPLGWVLANIFMCHFEEKWVMNKSQVVLFTFVRPDELHNYTRVEAN